MTAEREVKALLYPGKFFKGDEVVLSGMHVERGRIISDYSAEFGITPATPCLRLYLVRTHSGHLRVTAKSNIALV